MREQLIYIYIYIPQPSTKHHNRGIYILSSILTFKPLRVTTFAFRHLNHSAPKLVKDVFNILQN